MRFLIQLFLTLIVASLMASPIAIFNGDLATIVFIAVFFILMLIMQFTYGDNNVENH